MFRQTDLLSLGVYNHKVWNILVNIGQPSPWVPRTWMEIDLNLRIFGPKCYYLVMTNSLPWKITMLLIGKPSICRGHLYHGYVK